jgi:hypothetical protein
MAQSGGKIVGVFRVKNHDFTPKKILFFPILRGRALEGYDICSILLHGIMGIANH